jgi:hypothetical protein
MEVLKKTVQLIMTTGTTSGCSGNCRIIIPDTGVTYYFKILLTRETIDIGFFDAYMVTGGYKYIKVLNAVDVVKYENFLAGLTTFAGSGLATGYSTGIISGTTVNYVPYFVTGECTSRLNELRKYTITNVFANQYVGGGSFTVDGVDYNTSVEFIRVVYFIGGIRYVDMLVGSNSGSTFSFIGKGLLSPNFINVPYYKNMNKENIISNPKVNDDVFITRQELSAFDKNYRLEYIRSLIDLTTYAGGKFFNIVNNT